MGPCLSTSTLSEDDINMLLSKTHFTRAQIRKWHKGFIKDCPSGELNKKTFLDMYSQYFPDGKAKPFYEHLFRTFDQDSSGNIDFKEFLIAISTTQNGTPEEKLDLAFQLYDIDKNGKIEENEMSEIIKLISGRILVRCPIIEVVSYKTEELNLLEFFKLRYDKSRLKNYYANTRAIYLMVGDVQNIDETPANRTKAVFEKMDTNHDHVLSKEEFIKGCLGDEQLYALLSYNEGEKK